MPEDITGKWSYSTDGEHYHGLFDDRQDAINELHDYNEGEGGWVGQARRPEPPWEIIDASGILEDVNELDDYGIEIAERWCRATPEQTDELTKLLQATAREWFERHGLMPRFWVMDTTEKVEPQEEPAT